MLFVLTGSSGAGKTAVIEALAAEGTADVEDPRARPEVTTQGGWHEMDWARWAAWRKGDRRWDVVIEDTSEGSITETSARLASWIAEKRRLQAGGQLPLSGTWWR